MHAFVRNLLTEWRRLKLPAAEKTLIVAVSGGADSVSLLLALQDLREREKLKNRFVVAHFNHQLRGEEGEKDAQFVKTLCARFDFELALGSGAVAQVEGNLEQNARRARYRFLTDTAENLGAVAVLTAHTVNDQAETFLINLLRGSGLDGLGGMKTVRPLGSEEKGAREDNESASEPALPPEAPEILLVRPLLGWATRRDTEEFCRAKQVECRYDTMNEDLAFRRVRVRKILLPLLEDFNPKIVETLAQTAHLLARENERLGAAPAPPPAGEFLTLKELRPLPQAELYRVVRRWLREKRGNLRLLELKHIEAVERLIFSRKSGRTIELPGGGAVVKEGGRLLFKNFKVDK